MRFFGPDWIDGRLTDAEADAVCADYRAHIAALSDSMPAAVRTLAERINLHDGIVASVARSWADDRLRLSLRCGDLSRGYFLLALEYQGAAITDGDVAGLADHVDRGEVLTDEVDRDVDAEQWIHRLHFSTHEEVSLRFQALHLRTTPIASRHADLGPGEPAE